MLLNATLPQPLILQSGAGSSLQTIQWKISTAQSRITISSNNSSGSTRVNLAGDLKCMSLASDTWQTREDLVGRSWFVATASSPYPHVVAGVSVPQQSAQSASSMIANPAVLDNGIHIATQLVEYNQSDPTYVPVGMDMSKLSVSGSTASQHTHYAFSVLTENVPGQRSHNHGLTPEDHGRQDITISGLQSRPMSGSAALKGTAAKVVHRPKFSHDILDIVWAASDSLQGPASWVLSARREIPLLNVLSQEPASMCSSLISAVQVRLPPKALYDRCLADIWTSESVSLLTGCRLSGRTVAERTIGHAVDAS